MVVDVMFYEFEDSIDLCVVVANGESNRYMISSKEAKNTILLNKDNLYHYKDENLFLSGLGIVTPNKYANIVKWAKEECAQKVVIIHNEFWFWDKNDFILFKLKFVGIDQ